MAAEGTIAILFYSVEAVVSIAYAIREAAETVRRNKEECEDVAQCVASVSAVLNGLHQSTPAMVPAMRGALDDLAVSLRRALDLVTQCQEKRVLPRFLGARDMARELRRVRDDITTKVRLGCFAANVQTNITLTSMQQYAAPAPAAPPTTSSSPSPPPPMWFVPAPQQPVPSWTTSPAPVSQVVSSPWQQKPAPSMADFCCPSNWR